MRRALPAIALLAALVVAACSSGSTEVEGLSGETGATAETGPTGASAVTGATGATSVTGISGGFEGPVSLDLSGASVPDAEAAFFSCDGVLGTWTYISKGDFGPGLSFDINADVDLSSGAGTLVFGDEISSGGITMGWEDTVDLKVVGTADAPALVATHTDVAVTGDVQGFPVDIFKTFPENQEFPVQQGSDRC